jgi:steroid delta-isomerase-like uncharacterized protein
MSEYNKAIAIRWFEEVWNKARDSAIEEMLAPNAVAHGLGDSELDVHGPEEFKPFVANIRGGIPDLHIRLDDLISEGDRVAIRLTLEGTHSGNGLGVPPTSNKVRIQGIVIVTIVDGKIGEGWNSYDQLGLLRQIGALPGGGQRDRFLSANK